MTQGHRQIFYLTTGYDDSGEYEWKKGQRPTRNPPAQNYQNVSVARRYVYTEKIHHLIEDEDFDLEERRLHPQS